MHIFSAENDEMWLTSRVIVVVGLKLTIFAVKKILHMYIRLKGFYGYWFLNNVIEDQKIFWIIFFLLPIEPLLR